MRDIGRKLRHPAFDASVSGVPVGKLPYCLVWIY